MSRSPRVRWLAIALLTGLGACRGSTDNSGLGPDPELSTSIGTVAADEADAALNALSLPTLLTPIGVTIAAPCAAPSSTTDSDGDGIPDDATWILTAPPCRFTGYRGGTLDFVGQLRLQDPTPDAAGFGYAATLTALRATFTTSGDNPTSYSVTRNGTRSLSGTVAGLLLTADLQVIRTFTGLSDAAVDEAWTVKFTADSPLQINEPLPSGTLDVAGTFGWTRGAQSLDLTVTTPAPIHYNAGCTSSPRRFDAGELHVAGTFDGTPGYVRLRWTACDAAPEVKFVAD
jgi:hypothetical protein